MHQKIRQYLNERYLGWVILDSFPSGRLVSLMSRLNIEYTGVRMTSIPPQDLAYDLAEEAFVHREIMDILINVLDEANSEEAERISRMPEDEVKAWITEPGNVYLHRKIGKTIWGLLSDSRQSVNNFIPSFLEAVEEAMKIEEYFARGTDREVKKTDSFLSSSKGLKKILQSISVFEKEIAKEKKTSTDLIQENRRLEKKINEQQRLIQQLRKSNGELTQEKGIWHKQITKKEVDIQGLCQQIKELRNQLAVGPKMRLKSEIRRLEKENNNLNYVLEKERQENNTKINDLERELLQQEENFKELQQTNLKIHQELESQRQKFEELQKEYQLISAKKEPPALQSPKEKGKRLGVFIDNQNVYYSAKMHCGKKLDYRKLLEVLRRDRHLVKAICYIVQQPEINQERFISMLKNNGYTVRTRELIRRADGSAKGNWDIGIATDVITLVDKNSLDIVSLVTCDGDFVDLIKLLSTKGVRTEVMGFPMNMAMDLKKEADEYYFITEDLMVADS